MQETPPLPSRSGSVLKELLRLPVLVAALGYLVDMYDLFIFSIVRIPSLKSLQLSEESITKDGILLLNLQMAGLLLGGIVWGVLGDKRGRLSVLFGSILIYSLANIGNGMVHSLGAYAVFRFIAGFGLAGELGAGMTLVTETLETRLRGYGATLVATLGVFGALLAYLVSEIFDWRASYIIGGCLGLILMVMRIRVFESGIFLKMKKTPARRGDMRLLFNNRKRFLKYIACILMAMPIWYVAGILITFSPEFGKALGIDGMIVAGKAVLAYFTAQMFGNIVSGFLSQYLKSRKKVVMLFILMSFAFALFYLFLPFKTAAWLYLASGLIGFCSGYWTLFIAVAAELFGSNLRATVATTVPNFVRGTTILVTSLFLLLKNYTGTIESALIVGVITYLLAFISLKYLEETFSKEMDYIEKV